jgi:hypothetical protein
MKGYHVAFSPPVRDIYSSLLDMRAYELLTLCLSCLFWKKHNGEIKLYCDDNFYLKLKNMDLLWLWDEVDNITMRSIPKNLDHNKFWSYSKMYINSLQTEPFFNIDLDLFTRQPIKDYKTDFVFAHYEIVDSRKNQYYDFHKQKEFKEFFKGFKLHPAAVNTSVLGVNNVGAYKEFMKWIDEFVIDNWIPIPTPVRRHAQVLFTEQRLMFSWCLNNGYTMDTIMDRAFDMNSLEFFDYEKMDDGGLFHLWVLKDKFKLKEHEEHKMKLTLEMVEALEELFPDAWEKIKYSISKVPV